MSCACFAFGVAPGRQLLGSAVGLWLRLNDECSMPSAGHHRVGRVWVCVLVGGGVGLSV